MNGKGDNMEINFDERHEALIADVADAWDLEIKEVKE